ncbi:MAG: 4-hydroxy-2-oxovalerate aldolase [Candidatus Aquirickettsiella gammari]|jgi:4-hydroxy 2-oxovalerate aldolase|uniref:4-hydroxy-2-oxovalerate aldolase n=1 Tax=Candidatus Aquirickettsiella gammari TaxID=2016198 RepID=A0A370CJG9_9COXI|nr:MAG: 4-hydroxy-2-oxovalerate aldolase [Candidatus Aquirickettsiella gammari]
MRSILISDPTLRDGNHALKHQLSADQIAKYCIAAEAAGIPIVEVGHGNGSGASSLQLGISKITDKEALRVARRNLKKSRLGIHIIPGFGTIEKDLRSAIDLGVDIVRVATHCSEADITERHIQFVREQNKTVYGVLMMSHMISKEELVEQASKMETYGAQGIIFMDSAGYYLPEDVTARVEVLVDCLSIPIGFHAHNNLGLAIANSLAAVESGASILDACARGFGAGAGNTQLEVLLGVLERKAYHTGIDFYKMLDASDLAEKELLEEIPSIKSLSIVSGLAGVFSGFLQPVLRIGKEFNVDPRDIFIELGRRKIVAGQEDIIIEVASNLANKLCKT